MAPAAEHPTGDRTTEQAPEQAPGAGVPPSGWGPPTGPPVIDGEPPAPAAAHRTPAQATDASRPPRDASPPDPAQARRAGSLVLRFSVLVLASLVCARLPLPWQLASLLFSIPAVVVGAFAVRAVIRARLRAPVIAFTAAGVAMSVFVVLAQLGTIAFWPAVMDRQECLSRALTASAERACQQDYERRMEEILPGAPAS